MGNYNDQIGANSRPNLGLDGIDTLPVKRFNPKILFDPFEEQFDLPPAFVILADLFGVAISDIGKQNNILIIFRVDQPNPPQGFRITMFRFGTRQSNNLVALQAGRAIDRRGGFSVEPQILFGSNDEEASRVVQMIQTLVIQVPAVHNVDASGHNWDHIQDVHIVGLAIGDVNKGRYRTFQVHNCMNFNGGLVLTKRCPWEQRQTQVDRRGVQGFYRFGEVVVAIELLGMSDQYHSQIMINLPGAVCIGIGQRTEWYLCFDSHMIATRAEGIEGGGEISEARAKGELSETHTKELIPT